MVLIETRACNWNCRRRQQLRRSLPVHGPSPNFLKRFPYHCPLDRTHGKHSTHHRKHVSQHIFRTKRLAEERECRPPCIQKLALDCIRTRLFLCYVGLFAQLNYLPRIAVHAGVPLQLAQYTVAIANAGSMIGRIVPGFLSDRLGQFDMMYFVSTLSGVLVLAFWLLLDYHPSAAGIIIFALLFGFASGGFVSLGPPCVVELAKGKAEEIGVKLGGFCLAVALGALTRLPIEGAIRDQGGPGQGFVGLMIYTGVVLIVGGILTAQQEF